MSSREILFRKTSPSLEEKAERTVAMLLPWSDTLETDSLFRTHGMERFVSTKSQDPNKELVDADLEALYGKNSNGWPNLVVSGAGSADARISPAPSRSDTHGGFDNDEYTMNSVLYRILGQAPKRPFTLRDLQY